MTKEQKAILDDVNANCKMGNASWTDREGNLIIVSPLSNDPNKNYTCQMYNQTGTLITHSGGQI